MDNNAERGGRRILTRHATLTLVPNIKPAECERASASMLKRTPFSAAALAFSAGATAAGCLLLEGNNKLGTHSCCSLNHILHPFRFCRPSKKCPAQPSLCSPPPPERERERERVRRGEAFCSDGTLFIVLCHSIRRLHSKILSLSHFQSTCHCSSCFSLRCPCNASILYMLVASPGPPPPPRGTASGPELSYTEEQRPQSPGGV